ncbi:Protein of unknown function [Gryllus bimaculatus]|nr:Protein of unknown function [Gryllus bimaculatus]
MCILFNNIFGVQTCSVELPTREKFCQSKLFCWTSNLSQKTRRKAKNEEATVADKYAF